MLSTFIDSPAAEELHQAIAAWPIPQLPDRSQAMVQHQGNNDFWSVSQNLKSAWDSTQRADRNRWICKIVDWLYEFIRLNVKRGRIFDLREVLKTGQADCLGYCKLFTVLGRYCGLDAGVVDVIVDNRGFNMPHSAILVRLVKLQPVFIDFWYGSRNPHYKRLGLRIRRNTRWKVADIDSKSLRACSSLRVTLIPEAISASSNSNCLDYTYLPDSCVDGITFYIEGNRSLKNRNYLQAVEQFNQAIKLYPVNARVYYNRAIAYERLGYQEKARRDYARALKDEAATRRTLAVQPEEVVDLIQLDKQNIPEKHQQIYLLRAGFVTGKRISIPDIARKIGLSISQVQLILDSIEYKLRPSGSYLAKKAE
jgi:tetratricopeptide (TPR) repeat protein